METVFITGGTGFIGRRLVKEMVRNGEIEAVWCLYRDHIPFRHEKLHWVQGDMEHLPEIPDGMRFTKVVHCAALMARGTKPKTIREENVKWTRNIIRFCRENCAEELIFFSSINVHLKHCGAYAESKRACERLVRESGIRVKIVRPALVYGKGKNGITSLIGYIRHLPAVPVFGNGHAKEQPIFVDDLAKITVSYMLDPDGAEAVEFCGKEAMEYDDMVRKIAGVIGKKAPIIHLPFAPFYYGLRALENLNLVLPISSEQVAHIYEDLDTDMRGVCERYGMQLSDFTERVRECVE